MGLVTTAKRDRRGRFASTGSARRRRRHVGKLLPNAPEVRLEIAPGGHLGVLTGRSTAATIWATIDDFLDKQPA
jgi:polyhydroxyalkanoate synthase